MKQVVSSLFIFILLQLLLVVSISARPSKRGDCRIAGTRNFDNDIRFPSKRNALTNKNLRWPNGIICYEIEGNFTAAEKKIIKNALRTGYAGTCIKAKECKRCCNRDYVAIINSGIGCYSDAGRIGGRQELNLAKGCVYHGTVLHEFLHSVGFMHEHCNPNRDDYVYIAKENVFPNQTFNFKKLTSEQVTDYGLPYDYCSIMHYDECAFSNNGEKTIIPVNEPDCDMGNVEVLSDIDIQKVNRMYECSE